MYVILLSCLALNLHLLPPVVLLSSPRSLTKEVKEDAVFMVNGTAMLEAMWGVRYGDTNYLNPRLYRAFSSIGAFPDPKINSTGYAGRVSFVGDLSKGQAWFKITNLNINDTNQYMVKIILVVDQSRYRSIPIQLVGIHPVSISSPGALTREVGQDVVFMFNASNSILAFSLGIKDGNTNNLKQGLITGNIADGIHLDVKINSTSYAGRVSFVGDLSKGQAWFKITNLNINDTKQYMARIVEQGVQGYQYASVQLTVVLPAITTRPLHTSTTGLLSAASSSPTNYRPTTSQVHPFSNRSVSIKVVREVRGDLSDPNSTAFRKFSANFVSEINSVYRTVDNFEKATVTSLSKKSIPVKFVVYFKYTTKSDEICTPLQNAIKDNRLGSLKIVPGSLGCSNESSPSSPKNQTSPACNCTSIIAACVTIIILLILAVVLLLIYVWKLRSNTGKGAGSRSSSTQEKDLEAYENAHPLENTPEAIIAQKETPRAEKELYETINENRDKAVPSLPQHYQELQRKAPNPTPQYEPLKQRNFGNKEEVPQTYEHLQQSASGGEYQSLSKRYKDTESKV